MSGLDELDTPAALVDRERLEANLARWQARCDERRIANRPHIKTHRCVEIARRQLELGAVGITCQKLGEAEVMAAAGIRDILVSYNLLGERKLDRLAALLPQARITVPVDDERLLDGLGRAAARAGGQLDVLVDCDTGYGRTGVQSPEQAVELARAVARDEHLRFAGFFTYPALREGAAFLTDAIGRASAAGLAVDVVSSGGTPTMWEDWALAAPVTEYRVGTYAFHDRQTAAAGAATLADAALTVLATVVSRPAPGRAILDAGSKALAADLGPNGTHGAIVEAPGSAVVKLNEEHAIVELGAGETLELGQRVRVVPNHACVVANLFDRLVVTRGGEVEDTWAVAARGRSQ